MPHSSPIHPDLILDKRYKIVRMLGQGGFGRVYLAENLNRFHEYCVLKEFAPQVKGTAVLQRAAELFQREAGVLYQLHHPQIPEFRELIQTHLNGEDYLFLVQQYIEGPTYWELLEQGQKFSETDALGLLLDLLPVLEYIHAQGVIHRDISPDNLIQQRFTGKPVLIDFGGVKQVAATAVRQLTQQPIPTQLEKPGYTPIEQRYGKASAASDLYALAVTILVLLTGKNPADLYDAHQRTWCWRQTLRLNPQFAAVLEKMLAERECDRYASTQEVRQALQPLVRSHPVSQAQTLAVARAAQPAQPAAPARQPKAKSSVSRAKTWVVAPIARQPVAPTPPPAPPAPALAPAPVSPAPSSVQPPKRSFLGFLGNLVSWLVIKPIYYLLLKPIWYLVKKLLILGISVLVFVGVSYWFGPALLAWLKDSIIPSSQVADSVAGSSCQEQVLKRYEALNLPTGSFYPQVNEKFYAQHPELKGRTLTSKPEDAPLRQDWCQIADEVLDQTERSQQKLK
ncbi:MULTISPECIES: serine/threonine-protein kinase [Trichocoleus]|uniref:non-specific serine/threonine protein kinase n=1 Tax=Trichocoleus desertorum GB2-A4 TaxID=2933944 RepID=A0ABV0J713_9CYAN|nr:serine/threonine-protein kinase [Trichocoleus sp. FACHB-46]MBD1863895.1 serine/threonine protein kinase [Trichocoleus sp. FACHB-46]